MKDNSSRWSANELVPVADRRRYMMLLRAAMIAAVAFVARSAPGLIGVLPRDIYPVLGAWAGFSALAELLSRILGRRALFLFASTVIVDGVVLVWLSTVGSVTNVRYLILLDMVAVVLLASYRTGLKVALWYALLLFTTFFAQRDGTLGFGRVANGTVARWDIGQVALFVAVVWILALATAAFSSVNERELRRRRFDMESLARFAVALESAADRKTVAAALVEALGADFPVGRLLVVSAGRRPAVIGQRGLIGLQGSGAEVGPESVVVLAESHRRTLLVDAFDPAADQWLSHVLPQARNVMVVPLYAEGGCVGALVVEHGARNGSRVERRLVAIIERFASHTALALRNAGLLEEMERMASTDGLTGVANRRTFESTLRKEIARSMRSAQPVSVVMLDLDDFKRLNDIHGHQAGDQVLRQVARALGIGSRAIDSVARYGGEEFAVIMPGCGREDALASAQRLHRQVSVMETPVPVTVSIGVATFPHDARTGETLVRAADDALYEAKRAGRNRVRVAIGTGDPTVMPPELVELPG